MVAIAGDDHGPHLGRRIGKKLVEQGHHVVTERIALLGAIEGDDGDVAVTAHRDRFGRPGCRRLGSTGGHGLLLFDLDCRLPDRACVFRFLDKIIVKGRKVPAEMFEIVCLKEDLSEEIKICIETYASGIEHYKAQRWDEALLAFEKSAAIEPNRPELNQDSPSTPSLVMIERVRALKKNPPDASWNGIFKMQTK